MTLTQAGNVGIGTTSPLSKLNVEVASNTDGIFLSRSGTNKQSILILADTSNGASISGGTNPDGTATATDGFGRLILQNGPDEGFIFQTSAVAAGSAQNWQTRMRIRNNGNVFINHPTDVGEGKLRVSQDGALWNVEVRHTFSTQYFMLFRYNSTGIGSIVGNGSSVAFNTTSDYRLKEDLKEIKGLEKLSALKVYDFKFKNSENRMDGVLAHELAEVLPYAVTGEKDAVDVDGNIKPQGVDYSKIVPILIKAIQELKTEIDSLKNQIK
jgi:hypothetical protein